MRNTILLACASAMALFMAPAIGTAQTAPSATNPESSVTTNPKSNSDTTQCGQLSPGETHMSAANCSTPSAATIATPKTMPKPKAKAKPATENTATTTLPPVLPTAPNACLKTGTIATTPSNPQCDTKSGVHEGGPFGH